jgi:hypothetical protein
MGELLSFDPQSPDLGKPCPAVLDGPFLAIQSESPVRLHCALTEGHAGDHFVAVYWVDTSKEEGQ